MKKPKYNDAVKHLIIAVGGKENIDSVIHCVSRMRFKLKDWTLIDKESIKKSDYAQGIIEAPSEFQVIIGSNVEIFYTTFCEINNFDENGLPIKEGKKDTGSFEVKTTSRNKDGKWSFKLWCKNALSFVSKVFAPLIPVLVGYGLIATFNALFKVEWAGEGTSGVAASAGIKTMIDIFTVLEQGLQLFITVAVGYTTFRAMKVNGLFGLALGVILTMPSLVQMSAIDVNNMPSWPSFGEEGTYPWKISFNSLILPMMLVGIFGGYMFRWTNKISNGTARLILQPFLVLAVTYVVSIFLIAPVGLLFTSYLAQGAKWASQNGIAKYMIIPIIAGIYGWLVILGLHRIITPILLQDNALYGGGTLIGFVVISNICQGIAALAFTYQYRKIKKARDTALPSGLTAFIGGITEPALFGVNFKYLYPLIGASLGVFSGTLLLVASNVFTRMGAFGIFGFLGFSVQPPAEFGGTTWAGGGMLWGNLSLIMAMSITFFATLLLGKVKFFKDRTHNILINDYDCKAELEMLDKKIKPIKNIKAKKVMRGGK